MEFEEQVGIETQIPKNSNESANQPESCTEMLNNKSSKPHRDWANIRVVFVKKFPELVEDFKLAEFLVKGHFRTDEEPEKMAELEQRIDTLDEAYTNTLKEAYTKSKDIFDDSNLVYQKQMAMWKDDHEELHKELRQKRQQKRMATIELKKETGKVPHQIAPFSSTAPPAPMIEAVHLQNNLTEMVHKAFAEYITKMYSSKEVVL
jgi:hypothetical protein